jgi:LPS O-antigen subunit length determinant protein (WzzB/FepE family)
MQMKNKKLFIIGSLIIVTILALILYFVLKPKQSSEISQSNLAPEELILKDKTDQIVNIWGNFEDNTSDDYLKKLEPYFSAEAFTAEKELADSQKYYNEQAGSPLKQKYTIKKVELVESTSEDGEIRLYKVSAIREFADQAQDSTTYVKYEKINDEWKIISIESD